MEDNGGKYPLSLTSFHILFLTLHISIQSKYLKYNQHILIIIIKQKLYIIFNYYFKTSSYDIQNTPSQHPSGINIAFNLSDHMSESSDQSPFHEKCPQGFLNFNNR